MPAQIYVAVAVGDDASRLTGDFGVVSKAMPDSGVAEKVVDFKACIIKARMWTNVLNTDLTILGPWATEREARASFALAAATVAPASGTVESIELAGSTAYVVARVATGVIPQRGASGFTECCLRGFARLSRVCDACCVFDGAHRPVWGPRALLSRRHSYMHILRRLCRLSRLL